MHKVIASTINQNDREKELASTLIDLFQEWKSESSDLKNGIIPNNFSMPYEALIPYQILTYFNHQPNSFFSIFVNIDKENIIFRKNLTTEIIFKDKMFYSQFNNKNTSKFISFKQNENYYNFNIKISKLQICLVPIFNNSVQPLPRQF